MQSVKLKSVEFPTRVESLRELNKRSALDKELQDELRRLEAGARGEQFVLLALEEFGSEHWVVLPNVWLKSNGAFECDLVVLTYAGIYAFEIKNYSGHFEFRKMQCRLNGEKIGFNAINQAQRSYIQLEQLVRGAFRGVNVYGALVFVGEHNTVDVFDEVNDIRIVMRNELRNYIWEMKKQERNHQGTSVDVDACLQLFERYGTDNPFLPEPITSEMSARVRKGIRCSHCGSFDVDTRKSYVSCSCGMHEPRENAIVRTICEYGVIYFDKELMTSEVLDFFGGQVSRTNLVRYLNKHFQKSGRNKGTTFQNNRASFEKVLHEFVFTKPRYFVYSS